VLKLVESIKPVGILDYGCGKGLLAKELPFPIWEYDPAITLKAEPPRPADLVICTDVLEHIEPDKLQAVLMDLHRVTRKVGYFVICTTAARKHLPDGRNTHLIQKGEAWWRKNLEQYFNVASINKKGPQLHVVVGPRRAKRQSVKQSVAASHIVEAAHA
jgi:2-polyprenyl-3-methyl-5-hydroxy-6-metoxy-1,4-benzoquinol methylase